ncbi:hypothetical protein BKA58DRAFT_97986 [Alternaria rosae]|uniref:uncharacterized protein n=1 Tax=Alternaria rosae TaxID=1187941 RepID=UPI001E8D4A2D|nr:uncharacterized protein BKA58DRAFT_97986 [Alternaria rosae]KAH6878566.1 hypothetical protein BKA58DRAFT_97986 [Alternaria rosae]
MMPVRGDQPHRRSINMGGMNGPNEYYRSEYYRNETYDHPGVPNEQTLGHNYYSDSLRSGCYAFDLWPPSICEALTATPTEESYDSVGGSSSAKDCAGPSASDYRNGHESARPKAVKKKTSLRCSVCVDKPPFTGQYAQRNLNRHMEKHGTCAESRSERHIRCGQPGCTSTFGREDALLVHLRRSHPELNTPPAKKRKREE